MNRTVGLSLLFFVSIILIAGQVYPADSKRDMAVDFLLMLKPTLKLSDAQMRQILPIVENEFSAMQAIGAEKISDEAKQRRIAALQDDVTSQMGHYLTEQQLTQWKLLNARASLQRNKNGNSSGNSAGKVKKSKNSRTVPGSSTTDGVLQSGSTGTQQGGVY